MMKHLSALVVVVFLAIPLVGCGSDKPSVVSTPEEAAKYDTPPGAAEEAAKAAAAAAEKAN